MKKQIYALLFAVTLCAASALEAGCRTGTCNKKAKAQTERVKRKSCCSTGSCGSRY